MMNHSPQPVARREELVAPAPRPQTELPAQHFSTEDIRRAVKHHRRALDALQDASSFEGIRHPTAERLLEQLERDLHRLEEELERRTTP